MKISIITVTYNRAETLVKTMDSVLALDYNDLEYIVVDGASKDSTIQILKDYELRFKKISETVGRTFTFRWISESDKGLYDAMNKGIRMATGDVVGIINSDDYFHRKDIMSIVAKTFEENKGIEAVYGDIRVVTPENLEKTVRYTYSRFFFPACFRIGLMPSHATFFTYKRNFDKYGYYKPELRISADFDLLVRFMYVHKLKTKYIHMPFETMRTGGASMSTMANKLNINRDILFSLKANGIWSCKPLLFLRYPFRFIEYVIFKKKR